MSFKALVYAYVLGGLTFIPLLICAAIAWTIYTSVPVGDPDPSKLERKKLAEESKEDEDEQTHLTVNDQPKPRKAWLTVRRTFEEKEQDGSYVNMMRTFLDSRSKDPKRSRPKDMWYVVLKGNVLYLYEDESMTECEAAIQVSMHEVVIYPEGLMDGELFTKRNAICLKPFISPKVRSKELASVTREMGFEEEDVNRQVAELDVSERKKEKERKRLEEVERVKAEAKSEAFDRSTPWFIFVRSCVDMEDWYLALVHAANYSDSSSTLEPVRPVFSPADMNYLVSTLDEQPDVIPMRWLNALLGRIFFSFYRTKNLESFIIGRLMKKLSKVKMPSFLQNVSVTEVSVGNTPPSFSKPMLKDLTKEGDAALEIRVMYKGEIRLTVEATAIINLGQRFKTYTVKLVLAVVLRRLDGNLLIKVKRPPTNRIWYAFTQPPDMDLDVEPVVSDRQIKWGMICSTIESKLKEIINESIVMPNMDDIAFFESSQYMHRGGIWADASRKTESEPDVSGEPEKQNVTTIDVNGDVPMKSQSTDVLLETHPNVPADSVTEVDSDRVETASAPTLLQDPPKRRSWFGSISGTTTLEEEDESAKSNQIEQLPASDDDDRGRSLNVDTTLRRATSVPASKSSPLEESDVAQEAAQSGSTLTPEASQDSSSTHSRSRSLSSGANVLGSEQANSSRESLNTRGTNATSFLSTLRQKADKQAISNTAKEAMRKWSANWNGFKREHMSGQSNSNAEENIDGASQSSGSSSIFSFPTKGRNYADIRAAVSGRKENAIPEAAREGSSSSLPIDIPNKNDGEESENAAGSSSSSSNNESKLSASVSPQSSPKAPSLLRKEATRATISPPRVTADTHTADNTTPAIVTPTEPVVVPPPIKTQPSQGAMMTIPGIHASHRGDIQSYGYTPPALPSPASTEGKPRTQAVPPAIQSVYRLFRSPTSNSSILQQQQEQVGVTQASPSLSHSPSGRSDRSMNIPAAPDANDDVTPLSLTPVAPTSPGERTPVSSSRPTPPPLPPRSVPSPRPTSTTSTPPPLPARRDSMNININTPVTAQADITIAPSASDALRMIARQDDTKRKDIESSPELRARGSSVSSKTSINTDSHPITQVNKNANHKTKRTSLGARRITSAIIISDEPESMHGGGSDPQHQLQGNNDDLTRGEASHTTDGEEQQRQSETEAQRQSQSDALVNPVSASTTTTEVSPPLKPKPPPLPPRRGSSTLMS
ncbi:uncharacterized protein FOMMEDRAFT_145929 [Fomitiporia mediterranea MF3/22]|uniref:uncharacterized protein n=1 Tax=Fomitiporia mediterranea (strain MF3/22) TaxID=694068 RepID=UPI0004408E86|nr:uncharacterized protein FOMMEDRAFT_145929 [Fomitiporia mediterranea MF3/22]EJD03721.1 hypothetical protein FOMMEDRAFT_145929 [Fomitiporia mediterranea MF3/22]